MYLRNEQPQWDDVLADKAGKRYSMVMLSTDGTALPDTYSFDYEAVQQKFSKVLACRKLNAKQYNTFGVLFTEASDEDWKVESNYILHSSLKEFLS